MVKRDNVIKKKLQCTLHSTGAREAVCDLKNILDDRDHLRVLNGLIDFTQTVHKFRKAHKNNLEFLAVHAELTDEKVREFIAILNGEHQDIKVYFDSKNFSQKAFEQGITITNGAVYTLADLRNNPDPQMIAKVHAYMHRTLVLFKILRKKY